MLAGVAGTPGAAVRPPTGTLPPLNRLDGLALGCAAAGGGRLGCGDGAEWYGIVINQLVGGVLGVGKNLPALL